MDSVVDSIRANFEGSKMIDSNAICFILEKMQNTLKCSIW